MNDFAAQFPFELLDEDVVLNDEDYQNYRGRFNESDDKDRGLFLQRFLVPKTYKPLQESLFKTKNSNANANGESIRRPIGWGNVCFHGVRIHKKTFAIYRWDPGIL